MQDSCEIFSCKNTFGSQVAVVQEGVELLPCCDFCGMNMASGRLIKHRQTAIFDRNMHMRWRIWDVAISNNSTEVTFILAGEDGEESRKGVYSLKYMGRILHWSDEVWMAILSNIWKARQFWGSLGKLLQWKGVDPIVSGKFYYAVVQAVLLLGAETWLLMAEMSQKVE